MLFTGLVAMFVCTGAARRLRAICLPTLLPKLLPPVTVAFMTDLPEVLGADALSVVGLAGIPAASSEKKAYTEYCRLFFRMTIDVIDAETGKCQQMQDPDDDFSAVFDSQKTWIRRRETRGNNKLTVYESTNKLLFLYRGYKEKTYVLIDPYDAYLDEWDVAYNARIDMLIKKSRQYYLDLAERAKSDPSDNDVSDTVEPEGQDNSDTVDKSLEADDDDALCLPSPPKVATEKDYDELIQDSLAVQDANTTLAVSTNNNVDASKSEVDLTDDNVDHTKGNVDATDGDANATEVDVDTTEGDVNATEDDVDATRDNVDATDCDVDATDGDANATEGDVDTTKDDVDAANENTVVKVENDDSSDDDEPLIKRKKPDTTSESSSKRPKVENIGTQKLRDAVERLTREKKLAEEKAKELEEEKALVNQKALDLQCEKEKCEDNERKAIRLHEQYKKRNLSEKKKQAKETDESTKKLEALVETLEADKESLKADNEKISKRVKTFNNKSGLVKVDELYVDLISDISKQLDTCIDTAYNKNGGQATGTAASLAPATAPSSNLPPIPSSRPTSTTLYAFFNQAQNKWIDITAGTTIVELDKLKTDTDRVQYSYHDAAHNYTNDYETRLFTEDDDASTYDIFAIQRNTNPSHPTVSYIHKQTYKRSDAKGTRKKNTATTASVAPLTTTPTAKDLSDTAKMEILFGKAQFRVPGWLTGGVYGGLSNYDFTAESTYKSCAALAELANKYIHVAAYKLNSSGVIPSYYVRDWSSFSSLVYLDGTNHKCDMYCHPVLFRNWINIAMKRKYEHVRIVFHGSTNNGYNSIRDVGFTLEHSGMNGSAMGTGIYVSSSYGIPSGYNQAQSGTAILSLLLVNDDINKSASYNSYSGSNNNSNGSYRYYDIRGSSHQDCIVVYDKELLLPLGKVVPVKG